MRVLMLGWEFPPFIAGGLGVACYGLTKALDRLGHQVVFILPKPIDRARAQGQTQHLTMLGPFALAGAAGGPGFGGLPLGAEGSAGEFGTAFGALGAGGAAPFAHARFLAIPASFAHPYPNFAGSDASQSAGTQRGNLRARSMVGGVEALAEGGDAGGDEGDTDGEAGSQVAGALAKAAEASNTMGSAVTAHTHAATATTRGFFGGSGAGAGYGNDLVGDSERYARLCVALTRREQFDVIHAHDWLTFPAGVALARVTGRPLIVHVHSTEFDRSGSNVNQRVYDIERMGMHAATRVLCVSGLTKNICMRRYGVPSDKIDVVYNGLDREAHQPMQGQRIESTDKIVLFLGRITMQKGPEYFISAAKRVLEKVPDAKFVLAGSGDMALRMIDLAASLGIGGKVLFTGFLRGGDIERVFKMADCYVMPSVSEPFGIAALEAISHDVPVILSRTSGASEVLQHVLKVDFWDIDDMANKIVAVLRHPPLSSTLRQHGQMELQRLTWDDAARKCVESYESAVAGAGRASA
jgi:glycosyltransferase involved in cell wall biosynthesis